MNWVNLLTIVGGAVLTVLPQVVASIPSPYKDVATAALAAVVSVYHLWQPSPSSAK